MCARQSSIRPDSPEESEADREEQSIAKLNGELKECPMCGEYAATIVQGRSRGIGNYATYRAECDQCGVCGGSGDDPREAFDAWNTRKPRTLRFLQIIQPAA